MPALTPHIAIVDDNAAIRAALSRLLQSACYATQTYDSGEAFLAHIDETQARCVIMDIHMAGMGGLAAIATMQRSRSPIPVIVLTGRHADETEEVCLRFGVVAYLRKPIEAESLLQAVDKAIASYPLPPSSSK